MRISNKVMFIIQKLDALNKTIDSIQREPGETEFAQSMRMVLVRRLEKERTRLVKTLNSMPAQSRRERQSTGPIRSISQIALH